MVGLDLSEIQESINNQAESPQKLKIQESKALKYRARCACKLKQELLIYSKKSYWREDNLVLLYSMEDRERLKEDERVARKGSMVHF